MCGELVGNGCWRSFTEVAEHAEGCRLFGTWRKDADDILSIPPASVIEGGGVTLSPAP